MHILYVVALIILAIWAIGLVFRVAAGAIHLLLLIAVILIVWRLLTSRRTRV